MQCNPQNLTNEQTGVKCLLWGAGRELTDNLHLIKYYEMLNMFNVYAITAIDHVYSHIGHYRFIEPQYLDMNEFDVVIIMTSNKAFINVISQFLIKIGVDEGNIIPLQILKVPGFDVHKYITLRSNPPSIFAPNCWAGITYNQLGLQFRSPLINMFEDHDDYLKLLKDPHHYLDCELKLKEMGYETNLERNYPIVECDDILLYFNHYVSFEEANEAWKRRKARINWENILVMFFDEAPDRVEKFCQLKYERKICFAPFKSESDCVIPVEYHSNKALDKYAFWQIVDRFAGGDFIYYDVFDLLLYGKITKLGSEFYLEDL